MATNLSDGYIYFVESEAVGGDDWITDHAGDPDDLDLDAMTEGTEYCKLEIPQRWRKKFITGIIVTDATTTTFDYRTGRKGYSILAEGIETSVANADLVEKFFLIARHISGASATFKNHYMIIRFGTSNYATFIDNSDGVKEYCPIRCSGGEVIWEESSPQRALVRLQVRSIWQ